jgi:hypothetical protein
MWHCWRLWRHGWAWRYRASDGRGPATVLEAVAGQLDAAPAWSHGAVMNLPPDQPAATKPKKIARSRLARQAERPTIIRLRLAIWRELAERGITTPAAIGAALGVPPAEAAMLLTGGLWREGDVALLEAVAARLGVNV